MIVCVYVRVRGRKTERGDERVCVCVCVCERKKGGRVCVCQCVCESVREKEREK